MSESPVEELWRRYRDEPTVEQRNRLVLQFSPLVKYVAGRLRTRLPETVEYADLVSDGIIGLMEAIERFDPDRGLSFQTFAVPRIRGFRVSGVFEMGMQQYDSGLALVNMTDAEKLGELSGPTGIRLRLDDLWNAGPVSRELSRELGQLYSVRTWMQENSNFFSAISMEKKVMGIILSLIVLVAVINLISMLMMLVMVIIIAVSSIVMGSGNAPFFAFAAMTPTVASASGIAPVLFLLPMHFAASIARTCSPITAVIVVSAGIAEISPFNLIKRTMIPMAGAMLVNVGMTFFYYYRG